MIRDIKPKSPVASLRRDFSQDELEHRVDAELGAAVVGMSRSYIARALGRPGGRPKTLTLAQILFLLDLDGYQETFLPRSKVPEYLLSPGDPETASPFAVEDDISIFTGDARKLIPALKPHSVQCVVTSSPYWGMRLYDNDRDVKWADGEQCPYGFE